MRSVSRRGCCMRPRLPLFFAIACVLQVHTSAAQEVSGALIGTVEDAQGGVIRGAAVRVSSPVLIGGPRTSVTNDRGQLRCPALPPGSYVLEIDAPGFRPYREEGSGWASDSQLNDA